MIRTTSDLSIDLSHLRDTMVEGIAHGRVGVVDDGIATYLELVDAFLETLAEWSATYDRSRATEEIHAIGGGWKEVEWIDRHLRDIIVSAAESNHTTIASSIFYLPIQLSLIGYRRRDHYVFNRFLRWIPFAYSEACQLEAGRFRDHLVDRCWRYLQETGSWTVSPDLEQCDSDESCKVFTDYASGILLAFNQLLKAAYDKRRIDDFRQFLDAMARTFSHFQESVAEHSVDALQLDLRMELAPEVRATLEHDLRIAKAHDAAGRILSRLRSNITFGLGAWLLREYDRDRLSLPEARQWLALVRHTGSVERIMDAYTATRDARADRDLGWEWWELEETGESGHVVTLQFERYLLLFALASLLQENTRDDHTDIRPTEDIEFVAEAAKRELQTPETEPASKWRGVVESSSTETVDDLIRRLDAAVMRRRAVDDEALLNAPLAPAKVAHVKENIEKAWRTQARMRKIAKQSRDIEAHLVGDRDVTGFGYNILDRKDVYVDETRISSHGWGDHYGRGMAQAEDRHVLERLKDSLPPLSASPVSTDEAVRLIVDESRRLRAHGYRPIVLAVNAWGTGIALKRPRVPQAGAAGDKAMDDEQGERETVVDLHWVGESAVILVDLTRAGVWRQYSPDKPLLIFS